MKIVIAKITNETQINQRQRHRMGNRLHQRQNRPTRQQPRHQTQPTSENQMNITINHPIQIEYTQNTQTLHSESTKLFWEMAVNAGWADPQILDQLTDQDDKPKTYHIPGRKEFKPITITPPNPQQLLQHYGITDPNNPQTPTKQNLTITHKNTQYQLTGSFPTAYNNGQITLIADQIKINTQG